MKENTLKTPHEVMTSGVNIDEASEVIIALHGRGASALDILPLARALSGDSTFIVAPQAHGNTWYPYSFMSEIGMNEKSLRAALSMMSELVDEMSASIPREKIAVIGFSQGACLALEFAARTGGNFGGVAAFTGGLIGAHVNTALYRGLAPGVPVFIGNSDRDFHVPLERSLLSAKILESLGARVVHKTYPGMDHTILQDEIIQAKAMLFSEQSN
jgi:phospholipase/carboxylesterase